MHFTGTHRDIEIENFQLILNNIRVISNLGKIDTLNVWKLNAISVH